MGTNCSRLVADLFLFSFMKSISRENQVDIIEAFNSISRHFDDLLNIDNIHFELLIDRIFPAEIQSNKVGFEFIHI